jgi:methyltransferase (TIGR00027 family)
MRDGMPSRTARHVAAYRLRFSRLPSAFGDPEADDRLASDVAAGVEGEPNPGMARYLRFRTAFFDQVVVNGLDRGVTQVAVVGAGYDGRALRYAKPGVRWFEVDHPSTQRDKRDRLARLAIATSDVSFVAADLVQDDVAAALTAEGFAPDAPSLLLCEGLVAYLAPDVVATLLARLRSIAAAGTRLALSTRVPAADSARRKQFADRVAAGGEPLKLGDADVPAMLTAAHWRPAELSEGAQRTGMMIGVPVTRVPL